MPIAKQKLANAIRMLSVDAVEQAKSGHPGMPLGMADIATVLWQDFIQHNPSNSDWVNRDRFILSNGHGSMLLYSLLHLTGYNLPLQELKNFRQLHSKTPGHPESDITEGVETTTGPLGQGFSNAVGMALAAQLLAGKFNQPGFDIISHYTYVFLGDGCLMEGISHEAASLAGTWGLGKLIAFWDDNKISIDGDVSDWFTEDTPARFASYGWQVIKNVDGHNMQAVHDAISAARKENTKPTLICCKTKIGFACPTLEGSSKTHGAPLGAEEIQGLRKALNWPDSAFHIPEEIYQAWDAKATGKKLEQDWNTLFENYKNKFPELAKEFLRRKQHEFPAEFINKIQQAKQNILKNLTANATRKDSQVVLNILGEMLPELIGGSADLTGSNLTKHKDSVELFENHTKGNYIYYGVREFAMTAIANGIALYKGFIPYTGTFLTFSDYARNAVRMSALMQLQNIFVYTHDSIGLGEDGPTHQPIEHLTMLRATPNLNVWRPANTLETFVAWVHAIQHKTGPSVLALTRQKIKPFLYGNINVQNIEKGGYIAAKEQHNLQLILIATGSEVEIAYAAYHELTRQGIGVRLVSMPCVEIFLQNSDEYTQSILPNNIQARIAIEAGSTLSWYKFVGLSGKVIGIDHFGASAPANEVYKWANITKDEVLKQAEFLLQK